jgi:hypothetical protein
LRSSPHRLFARLHIGAANNRHLYTLQASNATMSAVRALQEAAATILLDPRVASDTRGKGLEDLGGRLEELLEGLLEGQVMGERRRVDQAASLRVRNIVDCKRVVGVCLGVA